MAVGVAQAWEKAPKEKMNQCAVLLRHSYQSVHIENALLERGIPYTTLGLDSYLMRPEVLFVRGLLAVATDSFSSVADDQVREKVMQALVFFGGGKIEVAGREHETQEVLLAEAILTVKEVPHFLGHFFDNHVLRTAEPSVRSRLEVAVKIAKEQVGPDMLSNLLAALKIESLVGGVYVSKQRREDALGNLAGLKAAARKFSTAAEYFQSLNDAEQKQRGLKKADSLVLASVIDVKGLEFDHVILPFLARGEFPAPSATDREERNVFYVGITRARRFLTMFAQTSNLSDFVAQMGYKPATTEQAT